jgi:predicted nucleotidyltransferase
MPSRDYEEFIAAFNAHGVRYLVIGAHAVAFHARPRATKDLDIWIEPTPANTRKALAALRDFFGGADLGYTVADMTDPDCILQLGVAPVRIDLLSAIPGCPDFQAAWRQRVDGRFGGVPTHYIGLEDLLRNKAATVRAQDRADVGILRRAAAAKAAPGRSRKTRGKPQD